MTGAVTMSGPECERIAAVLAEIACAAGEVLRRYLARRRRLDDPVRTPWRFAPLPGTTALFDTGPGALAHLDAAPIRCEPAGMTADGFATLRLHL